jgi:hypothetical protein
LKHQWFFLHPLDSVTTIRRLVDFYVQEHNKVPPHSAFRGQTPDETYFGTGAAVPVDLAARGRCPPGSRECEPIRPRVGRADPSRQPHDHRQPLTAARGCPSGGECQELECCGDGVELAAIDITSGDLCHG